MDKEEQPILEIKDLKVTFRTHEGLLRAVDGVTFSMRRGRVMGLVGESGCGKSVTSFSILNLIQSPGEIAGGSILFNSKDGTTVDIAKLSDRSKTILNIRGGKISMIYQEPMTALSPVHKIGAQISEAILSHQDKTKQEAREMSIAMLSKVGIPGAERRYDQYPFELSGGMRQRAVIAMALVCNPEILIADEPTTALDVTIQAQIIRLMKDMQKELGTSILLITHDLGVVAQTCDDAAVMYLGRIVEKADVLTLMTHPRHPYTRGLLASLPSLTGEKERLPSIEGTVPSLTEIPPGCPFHPRCPYAEPGRCDVGGPPPMEKITDDHEIACVRWREIDSSPLLKEEPS